MSNLNTPFGLKPINENGSDWSGQGRLIAFNTDEANNIFLGDPIVPTGVTDSFGVPFCTLATAGAHPILGGFLGRTNGPAAGGNASATLLQNDHLYRTASILTYGFVTDDPNQLFAVQEDSVGGAIAVANAGYSNGNLVSGSGNTSTAMSGWQLQSSSVASGNSTFQIRVIGLLRGPDNAIGVNAKWMVRLNTPALWQASGF